MKHQVVPNDKQQIESIIRSEQYYYVPPRHNQFLLAKIWEVSQLISNHEIISFNYMRQDGELKSREVKPVAIMFSEFYFYLVAYMKGHIPIIFRIDRMTDIKGTGNKFVISHSERFNEGEFRKRVQFMYSGDLRRVTFKFKGAAIEAVLDRLPTAEIIKEEDKIFTLRAEEIGRASCRERVYVLV